MCGILCEVLYRPASSILEDTSLLQRVKNRGPNCFHSCSTRIDDNTVINFCGAVLWTQGTSVTAQPVENEKGVLLFNGDIYNTNWDNSKSDTHTLMQEINKCNSSNTNIIELIRSLNGPFCIIYFNKQSGNILFARDSIGRGSLLLHKTEDALVISSVLGRKYQCIEVPAHKIYQFDITTKEVFSFARNCSATDLSIDTLNDWIENIQHLQNLPDDKFIIHTNYMQDLDTDDVVKNYIENVSNTYTCKHEILKTLLSNESISETVRNILHLLTNSIKTRVEMQPNKCENCLENNTKCNHSSVGILFSGGLDCTILAYLADKYVPKDQSIDLINVAFETETAEPYKVPDRVTGKSSYEELKNICSSRNWVFREVNVTRDELQKCQSSKIADLVFPRKTILDESLGSAFWYAAWGCNTTDRSPCRILLLGSGADELFGGYTRHRNVYKRLGWHGLAKELMLEWNRISFRNVARDNRVICDHGRIPRLPYLDENFTQYVLKLKPWFRCYPNENLGIGVGDKLFLRLLATHLKLNQVATLPKRALQFGSRIANKKQKGNDISINLK